jgi:SAM-dependent methyltransferase
MWEGSVDSDKGGKRYWDNLWNSSEMPGGPEPSQPGLGNYVNYRFHEFFSRLFSNMETRNKRLLEIGCARSIWLPYFAKEFGFRICGIDYSEVGCDQTRQLLLREGVEGDVVCSNFFSPPLSMLQTFDIVVSFGVVEHFADTNGCIEALSRFLKPEGMLITNIPNLRGWVGWLQRILNPDVFDIHVPLSPEDLADIHRKNGFGVLSCDYFLLANFGVLNIENLREHPLLHWILPLRSWTNKLIWIFEKFIPFLMPNAWSSPYINCVALKASCSNRINASAKSACRR